MVGTGFARAASSRVQKPFSPSSAKPTIFSRAGSDGWSAFTAASARALPAKQTLAPESARMYCTSFSYWFSYIGTQVAPRLCAA